MKRVLLQRCCPTLAPGWVGFLAFRESFDPRPAIILASAVLRLGAAAGTNGESRFGRSEQTPAVGQPGRFLSRGEWLESARLAKDFDNLAKTFVTLASIQFALRRLAGE